LGWAVVPALDCFGWVGSDSFGSIVLGIVDFVFGWAVLDSSWKTILAVVAVALVPDSSETVPGSSVLVALGNSELAAHGTAQAVPGNLHSVVPDIAAPAIDSAALDIAGLVVPVRSSWRAKFGQSHELRSFDCRPELGIFVPAVALLKAELT
jgi:hypothetical protein